MSAPHVAVVVLSWNRREDTLACLRSLQRVDYAPLTVIVVDNASSDGTAEAVAGEFPHVVLVRAPENLGFAGGNNIGVDAALGAGADHVLILNNDVDVDPKFVSALVEEASRRPKAGALCSKILYMEPPDVIWYAGAEFDPRAGYNGRQRGYRQRDDGSYDAVVETDRACGAAMLVPRPVVERIGMFDPDLFLYAEDTDWSLRARAAGLELLVVPASRVWHKVSSSGGGENQPQAIYYSTRNTLEVCERHAPLGPLGTWRRRVTVVGAHAVQALLSKRKRAALQAVWQGWRDFRGRRFGKRAS